VTSLRIPLLIALLLVVWPRHTFAQIYAWRDENGTLVLSDRKLEESAAAYEVPGAPAYRATTPAPALSAVERYEPLVLEYASRASLRPELVRAVIQVESGYNPLATSPKGAMGLMQLMPQTARELGVRDPYDPEDNIRGGTRYLRLLLDKYSENEELALAAYNAGAGAVDRYGQRVPPYRETREYVRKVGSKAGAAAERARAGRRIYKTIEIVDGRPVPRYSTDRPASGSYEIVER
jgi:soluble lytic murein transglycosylase-like protein